MDERRALVFGGGNCISRANWQRPIHLSLPIGAVSGRLPMQAHQKASDKPAKRDQQAYMYSPTACQYDRAFAGAFAEASQAREGGPEPDDRRLLVF